MSSYWASLLCINDLPLLLPCMQRLLTFVSVWPGLQWQLYCIAETLLAYCTIIIYVALGQLYDTELLDRVADAHHETGTNVAAVSMAILHNSE